MTATSAIATRDLARELYQLLRDIDPSRWRDGIEAQTRVRIQGIRTRIDQMLADTTPGETDTERTLRTRLEEVAALLRSGMPEHEAPVGRVRAAWNQYRLELLPRYENLAASLQKFDIHVPSLRPTNYSRSLFHVCCGLGVLCLVQFVFTPTSMLITALSAAGFAWTLEITRRIFPGWNDILLKILGPIAHPHESWRVNSATWYTTALCILAMLGNPMVGSLGVIILGFADPAAGLIGRRWGIHRLVNGRSVEGTVTFAVVGFVAAMAVMTIFYPAIALSHAAAISGVGAVVGAIVELYSRRIDDNISIPVSVALATLAMVSVTGI